jgi:hypothetical protein
MSLGYVLGNLLQRSTVDQERLNRHLEYCEDPAHQ